MAHIISFAHITLGHQNNNGPHCIRNITEVGHGIALSMKDNITTIQGMLGELHKHPIII